MFTNVIFCTLSLLYLSRRSRVGSKCAATHVDGLQYILAEGTNCNKNCALVLHLVMTEVKVSLNLHMRLWKPKWPLPPLGPQLVCSQLQIAMYICSSARIDLPCYHFLKERGVVFQHVTLGEKLPLSHRIFFTNACLDFGSPKSSFPLAEMTFG